MSRGEIAPAGAPGGHLVEQALARRALKKKEAGFLDAWKRGIRSVGMQYFDIRSPHLLELAIHRDQLRPNYQAIRRALAKELAADTGLFLCALYSIYNGDEGRRLAQRYYPQCRSPEQWMHAFDPERRAILDALLENYTDW